METTLDIASSKNLNLPSGEFVTFDTQSKFIMISIANAQNKDQMNLVESFKSHNSLSACTQISYHVIFVLDSSTVLKLMSFVFKFLGCRYKL